MEKNGIKIVGLGPGDPRLLTIEVHRVLQEAIEIYFLSGNHPVLGTLPNGVRTYFGDKESAGSNDDDEKNQIIIEQIIDLGSRPEGIILAVPGNPWTGDEVCMAILEHAIIAQIPVKIYQGLSSHASLNNGMGFDPNLNLAILDSEVLLTHHFPPFSPSGPVMITRLKSNTSIFRIKQLLLCVYPEDHPLRIIENHGYGNPEITNISLNELDAGEKTWQNFDILINPLGKEYSMEGFMEMVAHLRSPEGCPWDREQTHQSLRTSLLEETYEVLSALDNQDPKSLREELGDLLLQIVLHAQIAMENGAFKMSDVFAGIYRKIVFRHPHVFTQQPAGSTQSVLRNWEKLKEIERKENGGKGGGLLSGVPKIYPSLAQAQAYQERVKRVGFDWAKIDSVLEKVYEELDEVKNAEGTEELNAELGDLLFSVVNLVRWNKADAESVLREANQRFLQRFQFVEQKAGELGRQLGDMTLGEMDVLWDEAKENGL